MDTVTYRDFSGSAAQTYERFFVPAIASPVATGLLDAAALRAGEAVLDVACGTGIIARLAAAAVGTTGSVTAVDLAPDMIGVAAAIGRPRGAPIEWRQADAVSLPFPDRSYDVVVCQMGLMFIEDAAAAVEEMHRVLKPGGRVVLNTPGRIQGLFEQMERAIVEHIDPGLGVFIETVFSMSEPEALGELLIGAGFDEVETTEYEARFDLPSPAEFLWQYINLTPMAPVVAAAPDASRVAMEDQVVETCAPWVEEGRVPLDQPMVLASGRRA